MKGLIPARVPVHKTRKVQLNSHLNELLFRHTDAAVPTEFIRNLFQTPDLDTFYQINLPGAVQAPEVLPNVA